MWKRACESGKSLDGSIVISLRLIMKQGGPSNIQDYAPLTAQD